MPENPVGSKEQREELRGQRHWFVVGHHPVVTEIALDGLDIAEEMAWLLVVIQHIDGLPWEVVQTDEWRHWSQAYDEHLAAVLGRWQAWKQGR